VRLFSILDLLVQNRHTSSYSYISSHSSFSSIAPPPFPPLLRSFTPLFVYFWVERVGMWCGVGSLAARNGRAPSYSSLPHFLPLIAPPFFPFLPPLFPARIVTCSVFIYFGIYFSGVSLPSPFFLSFH
jgi:hypothetical protein